MEERITTPPDEYGSLALREIVRQGRGSERRTVLDLGRPSSDNVRFFAGLNCKLYISDFFASLVEAGAGARQGEEAFDQVCSRLLHFSDEPRFDFILAWDLLNYLRMPEVRILVSHLRRLSRPGTHILALVSIYQKIPDRPFHFFALENERVRYESSTAVHRESPRHKEPALLHSMGGFAIDTCLLLKHGMREYSFVLGDEGPRAVGVAAG